MDQQFPKFLKVFKEYDKHSDIWRCHLIKDDEVRRYTVCAKSLLTIGVIDTVTVQSMGWETRQDFIKNRLKDHECIDLLKEQFNSASE